MSTITSTGRVLAIMVVGYVEAAFAGKGDKANDTGKGRLPRRLQVLATCARFVRRKFENHGIMLTQAISSR